ncbi:MAG: hypothetical protein RL129_141 [Actinomycetota bacterium]
MQSEIPQLEVVTAVGDADAEDYVAQLLFSQGWNIVFRAFDMMALMEYFNNRPIELRTVLVFRKDLPEFDSSELDKLISPTLTMIALDGIPLVAHQVMTHIRSQLRLPLIVNQPSKAPETKLKSKNETILITGTTGSPGRSTIALHLALESGFKLYDFDFRSPSQRYLIERSGLNVDFEIIKEERPREFNCQANSILDIGSLPAISEMVNDRRWQAALLNSVFDSATKIIYVCKANGLSLIRLQKFIDDFPILLRKIPITYVFNMAGNTREERALERHFQKLVGGESSLVIPSDSRIANPSKSGHKVIGKLAALTT